MIPVAPVVAGLAVAGLGLAGLRLKKLSDEKKTASTGVTPVKTVPTTPIPSTPAVFVPAVTPITTNPDGSPHEQGTPIVFSSTSAAQAAVDAANQAGISVAQFVLQQQGAVPPGAVPGIVTTHDPSPSGDLVIRSGPSTSSPQIGGATKNGQVFVLNEVDGIWAEIIWPGDSTYPAVQGYAHKAFISV